MLVAWMVIFGAFALPGGIGDYLANKEHEAKELKVAKKQKRQKRRKK
jgi:hypothetical protein